MTETPTFKDYKEEQKYYKNLAKKKTLVYESGKEYDKHGKVIAKGKPYRKYKDRKIERALERKNKNHE